MQKTFEFKPIGYIRSDFKEKFGIPRQSGRTSLVCELVLYPEYQIKEAFQEIDGFSHLWLLFDFSLAHREKWSPTVRPPRLGGNKRVGVFASRSPFRPNPIGLSCVKFLGIENRKEDGFVLLLSGADLLDGTPIFDVKPYLPHADCKTDALGGYATAQENYRLQVDFPDVLLQKIPSEKQAGLIDCLADDPRPSYQEDGRIYGMKFAEFEIKFSVDKDILKVTNVEE